MRKYVILALLNILYIITRFGRREASKINFQCLTKLKVIKSNPLDMVDTTMYNPSNHLSAPKMGAVMMNSCKSKSLYLIPLP